MLISQPPETPTASRVESGGIPLIPTDAMAGFLQGGCGAVFEYDCDHYVIPLFKDAEFLISVKGSSMLPKYNSGDVVACKAVPMGRFFQWNKVYVINTDQGALIKRIHPGSSKDTLTLVSDNERYPKFEIEVSEIYNLAIVVGVIRVE